MSRATVVRTQEELDAALAAKAGMIDVNSPADVALTIGHSAGSVVRLRYSSHAKLYGSSHAKLYGSSHAWLHGSSSAVLCDSGRAWLYDSSSAVLCDSGRAWLYDSSSAELYGSSHAKLYGSSRAWLYGSSSAELCDSSSAELCDSSSAELCDSGRAWLYDSSHAWLYHSSSAQLYESSRARLYGSSSAELCDSSSAELCDSSSARLRESSRARLHGSSSAELYGSSSAELYGSSRATGSKYTTTHVHSKSATFNGNGYVFDLTAIDFNDPAQWCEYHGVEVADGIAYLYKAVGDNWMSQHGADYSPGSTPHAPEWNPTKEYGNGLHFCATPGRALTYAENATRFIKAGVRLDEIVTLGDKVKAPRVVAPCVEVDQFGDIVTAVANLSGSNLPETAS